MVTPDYYNKFVCIGGECKHNCCTGGWEIEVDEESMARFSNIGGEFGKKVLNSIDDENVFIRKNGKCPLLSDNGLCEMVCHGEDLCVICDEYPRFTEYFDDYSERGISLSCEAAADIILSNQDKVKLVGDSGKCDEELFPLLYNAREQIFDILQNRQLDIFKRMRLVLDYGVALQERINNNEYGVFSYSPNDCWDTKCDLVNLLEFLDTLDILDEKWHSVLKQGIESEKVSDGHSADSVVAEQLAVYFVYRYFLKALFDCDALSKLMFMAVGVMSIIALANICGGIHESARLFSIEIEHNEENIEAIYDEFLFNNAFSVKNIINGIN